MATVNNGATIEATPGLVVVRENSYVGDLIRTFECHVVE